MIDVRDDAEVAGQLDRHGGEHYAGVPKDGQLNRAAEKALRAGLEPRLLNLVIPSRARDLAVARGAPSERQNMDCSCELLRRLRDSE